MEQTERLEFETFGFIFFPHERGVSLEKCINESEFIRATTPQLSCVTINFADEDLSLKYKRIVSRNEQVLANKINASRIDLKDKQDIFPTDGG